VNAPARHEKPISGARVAREMLGRSPAWFTQHRPELEKAGFPKPLPVLNAYMPSVVLDAIKSMGLKWSEAEGLGYTIEPIDGTDTEFTQWNGTAGVYFAGFASFIKIGISRRIGYRLREIASNLPAPLTLHGVMLGASGIDEFDLHRKFKAHRLNGEWFAAAPEILEFIEINRRAGP
jgi:hypothetical protein